MRKAPSRSSRVTRRVGDTTTIDDDIARERTSITRERTSGEAAAQVPDVSIANGSTRLRGEGRRDDGLPLRVREIRARVEKDVDASRNPSTIAVPGGSFTIGGTSRILLLPGFASKRLHEHSALAHHAATHANPLGVTVKHSIEAPDEDVEDVEMHGGEEHERAADSASRCFGVREAHDGWAGRRGVRLALDAPSLHRKELRHEVDARVRHDSELRSK